MSPDFEIFSTLLLACPSLSRVFPMYCGGKLLVPRSLRAHGSFRAVCYCRMHGPRCLTIWNATRSRDFEKGWAALSNPFCRILPRGLEFRGLMRSCCLGKPVFYPSPRSARGGAWSGAGLPPAIAGIPHPGQGGRNMTDMNWAFWHCFELK